LDVDIALRGVAVVAFEARSLYRRRGVPRRDRGERARGLRLDLFERRHDLGHALAGEVLEIAGLENLHDAVPDVLGEAAVDPVLERGSEVVRRLIDVFGGGPGFSE
jgi:hypothetical protein